MDEYYYKDQRHESIEIIFKEEFDFSSYENSAMVGYNETTTNILNQSIQMFEQFVFKHTSISDQQKKIKGKGGTLEINVLDDRIQYNKLFNKIPENFDMNEISEKLKHAINIEKYQE
ncbi:hypothetical protein [Enterococcus hirae]|uniref:hypothetical protein n=1 Tax=Enterococcus hirae TaxID=1354 RepID=UPI000F4DF545|nr:hypothetical protein [Enterococcus hirae]